MFNRLILILLMVCAFSVPASATTMSIAGSTLPNYTYGGSTAKLRIWASEGFFDSDGGMHFGGQAGNLTNVFMEINCTVTGTTLMIPGFTLPSTVDSPDRPNVRYTAIIYDSKGVHRDTFFSLNNYRIPISMGTGTNLTWLQIRTFNNTQPRPPNDTYPTTQQMTTAINAAQPCPNAATTIAGCSKLSITPISSSNPIAVGDNDPRLPATSNVIYASAYGLTTCGLGTDNTTPLQNATNALTSGATLVLPSRCEIRIASTWLFNGPLRNITVRTETSGRYGDINNGDTKIVWFGADGGTVIDLHRVRDSNFTGFSVWGRSSYSATAGADTVMLLEQIGAGSGISSNNIFREMYFIANNGRATVDMIHIGDATQQNNEFHKFYNCFFLGNPSYTYGVPSTGTLITLAHANVKRIVFTDCEWQYAAVGIHNIQGSFVSTGMGGGAVDVAYQIDNWTDPITINGDNFEGTRQLMVSVNGNSGAAPIKIINGRYNDIQGGTSAATSFIDFNLGAPLLKVEDNYFANAGSTRLLNVVRGGANGPKLVWHYNNVAGTTRDSILANMVGFTNGIDYCDVQGCYRQSAGAVNGYGFDDSGNTSQQGLTAIGTGAAATNGYGYASGPINTLMLGQGAVKISQIGVVPAPTITITGSPTSSTNHLVFVIARNAQGEVSTKNWYGDTYLAVDPASFNGSNFATVSWTAVPDAADYQIYETQFSPYDAFYSRLIATVAAPTVTYTWNTAPANPFVATGTVTGINQSTLTTITGLQTLVTATATTYTAKRSDTVITCNAAGGAYSITLLPASTGGLAGHVYTVKKIDSSGNLCTVGGGGSNIDGAATYTGLSAQWKFLNVVSNGSIWIITGSN